MKMLLLATVFAAGVETCCDGNHWAYEQNSQAAEVCKARGGIVILERLRDEGGHVFLQLKSCSLPCDQRLTVEK